MESDLTRRGFLALVPGAAVAGALGAADARTDDICYQSLRELARLIRTRKLSAREVMSAHLQQIRRWNPHVNAIVAKLDDAACLALADAADARMSRGEPVGALHGLPWAFKDLEPVTGFPWSRGSPIFRDDRPAADSVLVERIVKAGALTIGKTNTPQFGMGSHTYNGVYGTTFNPYDLTKSAGGSSGGAAASVAAGMLPGADGSDLGGSLRNPGNFNNVVGFRPTVGLVPMAPNALPFLGFAVKGPIARSVSDAAYLLAAMAGADARDPACTPSDPTVFSGSLERSFKGVRVAWCPDLGAVPLDHRVRGVLESQRQTFEAQGCIVEDAHPDLTAADEVFLTMRAFRTWTLLGPLLPAHRKDFKPEAIQEIEDGARLSAAQVSNAMLRHGEILEKMRRFQENYPRRVAVGKRFRECDWNCEAPAAGAGVNAQL